MLVRDPDFPGGERVKLLDFGIAKMAEHLSAQPVRTKSDVLMGTPTYMSPEQCRGAKLATDRSDVYSLGVILYQMIAGQPPFLGASMGDLIAMHLMDTPTPLTELVPELSPRIWRLVRSLLAKKPSERPPMEKVHKALQKLEDEAKPDPSESALLLSTEAPSNDSQRATVDVPAPAESKAAEEPKQAIAPIRSAKQEIQRELPNAIVSDSRHIHIPRRTVHLLIGALATSAFIVTTGILLGTNSTGRNGNLARKSSEPEVQAATESPAGQDSLNPGGPGSGPVRAKQTAKENMDTANGRNTATPPERREPVTVAKRADVPHPGLTKSRTLITDEGAASEVQPTLPPKESRPARGPLETEKAVPASVTPITETESKGVPAPTNPQVTAEPSSKENPPPAAQPPQTEVNPTSAAPAVENTAPKTSGASTATPAASKPRAPEDPFDPLQTAEDYLLQGSYRRAMDLATQFGKQDPMRAWEIFGRAGCGLRSLERAQRALRELKNRQETARSKSLMEYCRLHKILLTDPGTQ